MTGRSSRSNELWDALNFTMWNGRESLIDEEYAEPAAALEQPEVSIVWRGVRTREDCPWMPDDLTSPVIGTSGRW